MPFRYGKDAAGARLVREGFAFTEQHDLEFALGYPHVVTLIDGPADESVSEYDTIRQVPRSLAPRVARWLATRKRTRGAAKMSEDEARAIVAKRMKASLFDRDTELTRLLEAIVGPEIVVDEITSALEGYGPKELAQYNRAATQTALWLGLGLLRCRTAVAKAQRARLEVVYGRWAECQMKEVLDMALHGGKGVARHGYRYEGFIQPFDLIYALDDAPLVRKHVKGGPLGPQFVPDARLAFIGGEPLVSFYAKAWPKIRASRDLLRTVADFGRIRSPSVVRMMREIVKRSSSANGVAAAWLARFS